MGKYYWDRYNSTTLGKYLDIVEKSFYYKSEILNNIDRVLDVGGGSGRISIPLVENFKQVYIIENDYNAIKNGLRLCKKLNYINSDLATILPAISSSSFDFIIANQVLSYFNNEYLINIITELSRICRAHGYFAFNFINHNSTKNRIKRIVKAERNISDKSYKIDFIEKILMKNNFEILAKIGYNNLPLKRSSNNNLVSVLKIIDRIMPLNSSHWILVLTKKR